MDILEITLKLLLAVALGGLIGLERESSQKPAGFRTNILICVGAAMLMILSELILGGEGAAGPERMRLAAAAITGIGFIGAGSIIQARGSITGITTAATIWVVAGLGLTVGAGYYLIAVIFTLIVVLTLGIFHRFEERHLQKTSYKYTLKTKYTLETLNRIKSLALHEGIRLQELSHKKERTFAIIRFIFPASEEKEQRFNQSLMQLEEMVEIKID